MTHSNVEVATTNRGRLKYTGRVMRGWGTGKNTGGTNQTKQDKTEHTNTGHDTVKVKYDV